MQAPALWQLELRIAEIASQHTAIPREVIKPNSRLLEDLNIDSLDLIELIMAVEEEFAVEIPDDISKQMFVRDPMTIGGLAEIVAHQWGTGKPSRTEWFAPKAVEARSRTVPFTQYDGVLAFQEWRRGPLHQALAATANGAAQFRRATDGMRCILMPEAEVEIGSAAEDALPDEQPLHRAGLSEFLIDAEPVSVQAYARFLNSIGPVPTGVLNEWCVLSAEDRRTQHFQLARDGQFWRPVPGTAHQPMILVSWFGAQAYGLWANRLDWQTYRSGAELVLPTEAQWEYAARGAVPRRFPWADGDLTAERAHAALHRARECYGNLLPLAPVNAELGMSPFDLHHMAGNVWQWCADWYSPKFFHQPEATAPNPRNDHPTGVRSERGGSWVSPAELSRSSYRRGRPPLARGRCLGFRCVSRRWSPSG